MAGVDDSQRANDEYLFDLLGSIELEEIDEARLLQRLSWRWSFDAIQQRLGKADGYVSSRLELLRTHNDAATATSRQERKDGSLTPEPEKIQRQTNRMLETIATWRQRAADRPQRPELRRALDQILAKLHELKNDLADE